MRFGLLCVLLIASSAAAHAQGGATLSGVVRDSVAGAPLAGAVVQLVATERPGQFDHSVVSDALGRFTIVNVPNGRYMLGFIHPMLDSLGLEPPVREVSVNGERSIRADLAIPGPARLRAAICGVPPEDSSAVVVGFVRDARDRAPMASAAVTIAWLELELTADSVSRTTPQVKALTADNGWFALCNLPNTGTIWLSAGRGADSTGSIEIQVPSTGLVRRELYLGSAQSLARLSGTVVTAAGAPIVGATVILGDASMARTDERGDWTLWDISTGSQMLDVRAVGYFPDRRVVDVVASAAPVRIVLPTLQSVLDTINVRATRLDRNIQGFETRRRSSGSGRFLTADSPLVQNAMQASDVFRMVPGMSQQWDYLFMRGPRGRCSPALYVNGALVNNGMQGLGTDDIDIWARPDEIAGVEIYAQQAPPQFQRGAMSGCGSIVIWTKMAKRSVNRASWKYRAVQVVVIVAVLLGVAALINGRPE